MCIRRRRRCSRSHRTYPRRSTTSLQRAMAKDPGERYASAGELGRAALAAAREAEAPARADPAPLRLLRDRTGLTGAREPRRARRTRPASCWSGWPAVLSWRRRSRWSSRSPDRMTSRRPERATRRASPPLRAASAWRPLPPMPTARQNMASTVVDGTIWVVGGLGDRFQRARASRGLRPGRQRLEGRSRPAGPAAPRDGGHVQGRARRDRRLDTQGIGSQRRESPIGCSPCEGGSG